MKKAMIFGFAFALVMLSLSGIMAAEQNVCCAKTNDGLLCQDVPVSQCTSGALSAPTSCKTSSFCKPGVCFDSSEGTCMDKTPQSVCNLNKGVWSATPVSQCNLGCCVLGDQAAFVTLTRCKKLSSFLGLETNYKSTIRTEVDCIATVLGTEKGACVYESELEKTCKFTSRADCNGYAGKMKNSSRGGGFYPGKLCSAEELGTNCGPTTKTACVPGKEEVYFIDSCGNIANIYDASKINDKEYWSNVKDKTEVCNPNSGNPNNPNCGNCDYLLGTFCRDITRTSRIKPTYGNAICADLNCKKTSNGNAYKHGESWCVYTDKGDTGEGNDPVGTRFYKHICVNGEELLEQCADYRQQVCVQSSIDTAGGAFSQAACRVNRWQDCTQQVTKSDCENTDQRDCIWKAGEKYIITAKQSSKQAASTGGEEKGEKVAIEGEKGACIPKNSPGLKFWEGKEATSVCAIANVKCEASFEKGLVSFGGGNEWKVIGSSECYEDGMELKDEWKKARGEICVAIGDCGTKTNLVGENGGGSSMVIKESKEKGD